MKVDSSSGFEGQFAGGYHNQQQNFFDINVYGEWWSSTPSGPEFHMTYWIAFNSSALNEAATYTNGTAHERSCRCVQD
jgi:hypothetical protein